MELLKEREIINLGEAFLSSIDSEYINTLNSDESFVRKVENFRKVDIRVLSKDIQITLRIIYEGLTLDGEINVLERELIAMFLAIVPISRRKKYTSKYNK